MLSPVQPFWLLYLQNLLKHQAQWISFPSPSHLLDTGVRCVNYLTHS
jgi:hypothetical protein